MNEYLPISKMAEKIGYSIDYLKKNRGILFFEGTHFFSKPKRTDWKVEPMIAWIENKDVSQEAKEILELVS